MEQIIYPVTPGACVDAGYTRGPRICPGCPWVQGGFWRHKNRYKNTHPQIGPGGGRKDGREPKENKQKPRKPTETEEPYTDLRGTYLKALTVELEPDSMPLPRAFGWRLVVVC